MFSMRRLLTPLIFGVLLLNHPSLAQNTVLTSSSTLLGGGTGSNNVAIGPGNNYFNANSADANVFVGKSAGSLITTGVSNVFTGAYSGSANTSGSKNVFNGASAGMRNTTGYENVMIGYQSGFYARIGNFNTFVGNYSGLTTDGGSNNSFFGVYAGANTFTGGYNNFSGAEAGLSNVTGSGNTFSGSKAGYYNSTGSENTYLGYKVGGVGPNGNLLKGATALGVGAMVGINYGLVLGDTANVKVGIGTAYPNQRFTLRGNINFLAYDNSMMLKNRPFLHFNEHESLALGLGSEIAPGAEKTLVLGSKQTTVQIPGIVNSHLPQAGQFLTVDKQGNLHLTQPRVQVASVADWSDKVFEPGYALRPLDEVEDFIRKNKHLPGVPSAAEMVETGIESTAFNAKLLEKIEELTLYVVALEKRLKSLERK